MTEQGIKNLYFKWLCHFVYDSTGRTSYDMLLKYLHDIPFTYILPMDGNRYTDGIDLRYRFAVENNIEPHMAVISCIDNTECSFLEMLVALCLRCEESIMSDSNYGDRTSQWFWNMIVNLGLGDMTDQNFDAKTVSDIVHRFMNRMYDPDGENGGIVRLNDHGDLRNIDIWYQVMWYLNQF